MLNYQDGYMHMTRGLFVGIACMLLGAIPSAHAQPEGADEAAEPGTDALALAAELTPVDRAESLELERPAGRPFNFYAGVDFVSMYISRGLVYSNKFSVQPWFELNVPLTRKDRDAGPIDGVSAFFGNWNSIQEGGPGLGQARTGDLVLQDNWYEADVYGGFRVKFWDRFQGSLRFNWYTSPSSSFQSIQEIDLRLSYDDSAFWGERLGWEGFSAAPSVRIAKETRDTGGPEQWYFQPSLAPSFPLRGLPFEPRVKFPLALGFGADGQYREVDTGEERHFGFFLTGVGVDVPLDVLPADTGSLGVSAGLDVIILSDDSLSFRGDRVETVGKFGINYSF